MMVLSEGERMLMPYLKHPDFTIFLNYNPNLQELRKKIKEGVEKIKTFHPIVGRTFAELDPETEKAFLDFAKICKENLK